MCTIAVSKKNTAFLRYDRNLETSPLAVVISDGGIIYRRIIFNIINIIQFVNVVMRIVESDTVVFDATTYH